MDWRVYNYFLIITLFNVINLYLQRTLIRRHFNPFFFVDRWSSCLKERAVNYICRLSVSFPVRSVLKRYVKRNFSQPNVCPLFVFKIKYVEPIPIQTLWYILRTFSEPGFCIPVSICFSLNLFYLFI